MKCRSAIIVVILLCVLLLLPLRAAAQGTSPIVHAVLFYSPTCPHCQYVITQTLPPLLARYGSQLQIVGIDVTTPGGQALFGVALQHFGLDSAGVPFLAIGETYLEGSTDIPEKLPGLIDSYLAETGVAWPAIPGLEAALATSEAASPAQPNIEATFPTLAPSSAESTEVTSARPLDALASNWRDRFQRDPAGNVLAVAVLVGMLGALGWVLTAIKKPGEGSLRDGLARLLPALCVVGLGIAAYLTYVEMTQVSAVCGPVGDCNTVQQSSYARLWGVLPIGLLGMIGYEAILVAWLVARYAEGRLRAIAVVGAFALATFGTMFSIYLTFLEPFVIGATCAWCLTSSVLMTLLMLLAAGPARAAYNGFSV